MNRTFYWSVWDGGYEWRTAKVRRFEKYSRYEWSPDVEEPCLIHPINNDDTYHEACRRYRSREYEPLEVPDLYQTFARTELTEEGVMAFASQYGELGEHVLGEETGPCEPFGVWRREIMAVRRVLQLHELVKASEEVQLTAFRWPDRDEYEIPLVGATRGGAVGGMLQMKPPQLQIEAWLLRYHLLTEINANIADRIHVELLFDRQTFLLQPSYTPKGLIGAIWLQVFHRFASGQAWRRCAACGRFLDAQSIRSDAQYCSDACKQRALRQRRKGQETKGMI